MGTWVDQNTTSQEQNRNRARDVIRMSNRSLSTGRVGGKTNTEQQVIQYVYNMPTKQKRTCRVKVQCRLHFEASPCSTQYYDRLWESAKILIDGLAAF